MSARPLLAALLLAGCAVVTPVELGWRQDMPGFQMQRIEWNHIEGDDARYRLRNLCGRWSPNLLACAIRIREGGQCVVFSVLTEEEAKRFYMASEGWSLWDHEVRGHCAGWTHD